jgi:hypothetical protein
MVGRTSSLRRILSAWLEAPALVAIRAGEWQSGWCFDLTEEVNMSPAKSAAERKREEREQMRAAGYVLRQVWVHPEDWLKVSKYLQRINAERGGKVAPRQPGARSFP